MGTMSVSPSSTSEPPWSSSEMSFDTVELAEISASTLAGPVVPCGTSYASSSPGCPGSDCPTIHAVRL